MKPRTVGATKGLAVTNYSRDEHRAEQVYVRIIEGSHPIEVDAWVGYASISKMRFTGDQARDLAKLLIDAVTA